MLKKLLVAGFMLRTIETLFVLTALAIIAPTLGNAIEREIAWTEDYEAAVQRAATTNSIVLLHFYGDYCPPCKLLDKKTFHDPALVSKMNENLVPIKINADRRRDLAQKFQVTRWPTDVYLFPNGDEIYRGVSNTDPSVYCKTIERIALRHRDWTVERNSAARVKERRQDRTLATNTPQIQSTQPTYAGNAGHSVRTQAATWTNRPGIPQPSDSLTATSLSGSRVIHNPYIAGEEAVVPPTPSYQNTNSLSPKVSEGQPSVGSDQSSLAPGSNLTSKHVVAHPISTPRNADPLPNVEMPQSEPNSTVSILPPNSTDSPQRVYAETVGLGGYCPVSLIEGLDQPNANGWIKGKNSFAVRHRGRVYYCASERARQTLLSNPDRYTPCLSGFDIVQLCKVGELHDGMCEFGCIQEGTNRVFLFESKANYDEFTKNSVYYSHLLDNAGPERVANELNGTLNR